MNKTELVKAMAEEADLTSKDAAKLLDAFIKVTTDVLGKKDELALIGFGTFSVAKRSARTARNFRTHELIDVPESFAVKFKAGKNLKERVNKKKK